MKKFSKQFTCIAIILVMSLMCLTSSANVVNTGKIFSYRPEYIPTQFTVNNQSILYLKEEIEDEDENFTGQYKFTIFDASFNEQSSFTTPLPEEITATVTYYDANYDIIRSYTDVVVSKPVAISIYSPYCYQMEPFILTQTLFNNDAAFEWIVPSYTTVDVLEEYEDGKCAGQVIVANGFKVISQNGSTLADISIPDSEGHYLTFDLYQTDAGLFLFVKYIKKADDGYYEYYYQVYKIDSEASTIEPVGVPRKVGVSPTTPHRGTPVNVSLGEPVDNGGKLSVVSVAGRTAFVQNLEPGSTEAVIDTNRLERGVYVVVVDDGKTKREATKIVVR